MIPKVMRFASYVLVLMSLSGLPTYAQGFRLPPSVVVKQLDTESGSVPPPKARPRDPVSIPGSCKDTYRKAIKAKNQKRWRESATLFQTALKQNGSESTERINISGFGNVQPYVPHYYLGVVLKNLDNCPAALKEWDDSERDQAIQKTNLYKFLQQNRDACVKKP